MITLEKIKEAYINYKNSKQYKNLDKYRKLSDGESADVFALDVAKRVKMEYMGALGKENEYYIYSMVDNKGLKSEKGGHIKDLVCSYGVLQAITRLYAEYGTSKPLIINTNKEILIDLDTLLAKSMIIQSWAGKVLIKGVISGDKKYSFYAITPKDYFSINNEYNPNIKDAYVVYQIQNADKNQNKKIMLCEIYEENNIWYKAYSINGDEILNEIEYPNNLSINGMKKIGLGYKDPNAKGWAVQEIQNIFGKSDYNDDLIKTVREIIIGDTLTSQAFQKVANPLIQVPDSLLEIDNQGRTVVNLDDRVVVVRATDRELKQIQMETKTNEWKEHRKILVDDIYRQTGVNDLAFGISIDGTVASGEAKRRSLERVIATVLSKREKCIEAFKKMIVWAYERLGEKAESVEVIGQDILSLSLSEKINIVVSAIQNNLMSLETAVDFLGLQNNKTDEEIAKIKNNLDYKIKEIQLLQQLESAARDERLQKEVENITEELINELIGG